MAFIGGHVSESTFSHGHDHDDLYGMSLMFRVITWCTVAWSDGLVGVGFGSKTEADLSLASMIVKSVVNNYYIAVVIFFQASAIIGVGSLEPY